MPSAFPSGSPGEHGSGGSRPTCRRLCPWPHQSSPGDTQPAFRHKRSLAPASPPWDTENTKQREVGGGVSGHMKCLRKTRARTHMHLEQDEAKAFTEELARAACRDGASG